MKGLRAQRIHIKFGTLWESPLLHVLFTEEDEVIVARCLDFTVSSHGESESKALQSLAEAIKEYILTAIERDALETIIDPAHRKYWRMFNELEVKQSMNSVTTSLKHAFSSFSFKDLQQGRLEINYA